MLVIVSDLRLGDGSLAPTLPGAAVELLARKLNALAFAASYRVEGDYRPVESIDLVLLGDVLDLIGSARWLADHARPWDAPTSPAVFETVSRIAAAVLENNRATLEILRRLAHRHAISVPRSLPATPADVASAPRRPVPVRIHYMIGDRDWQLHLPGSHYARLRSLIAERMGLVHAADAVFPHDPGEGATPGLLLSQYGVVARHGDIYDPLHFESDRDVSSFGDALAIELLARFQLALRAESVDLSPPARAALEQVGCVRPMWRAAGWIDATLEQTCDNADARSRVRSVWNGLVETFLRLSVVRSRQAWNPIDLAGSLSASLRTGSVRPFGKRGASGTAAECFRTGNYSAREILNDASKEDALRNHGARYVVYGHAPETLLTSLDDGAKAEPAMARIGFNLGAWHHTISPESAGTADKLSLVAFYRDGERGGLPFETCRGSWRRSPSGRSLRIDPPHAAADHSCRRICNTTLSDPVPGIG